jgi:hypothetical protein
MAEVVARQGTGFIVGANFPWIDCGWDFGPPPPGFTRTPARDWGQVERDLRELRALGITVVRWWVLAGGVNYPVGQRIETIATPVRSWLGKQTAWQLASNVALPSLPEGFLSDFARLCQAATNAGVSLLPSLLSFEWFDRVRGASRGRAPLVFGREGEPYRLAIDRFLDAVLDPLLATSRSHRHAIYAWEVVNEPDWVVRGGPLNLSVHKSVAPWHMGALLFLASQRIMHAGFRATVGFKQANPGWVQPYFWDFLKRAEERGSYVHQLHHYPTLVSDRTLAQAQKSPIRAVLVGEFPTGDARALTNERWADPGLREQDPEQYLARRLELIRQKGYGGAFLWASEPAWIKARRVANGGEREPDPRVRWSLRQQLQVRAFSESLGEDGASGGVA